MPRQKQFHTRPAQDNQRFGAGSLWLLSLLAASLYACGSSAPAKMVAPPKPGETAQATDDRDGDGIPDGKDGAPLEPEDMDGYEDEDGIPDPVHLGESPAPAPTGGKPAASADEPSATAGPAGGDMDGDGVLDAYDKCLKEAEDLDYFQDGDGCPEPDNDGDGVPDGDDACPNEPSDECGEAQLLDINDPIVFARGSSEIDLEASAKALGQVLRILKDSRIKRMEIRGHTDNSGAPRKRVPLSKTRAAAVKAHLVENGVKPVRLTVKGVGDYEPMAANDTPEGRAFNNRIEFAVLR